MRPDRGPVWVDVVVRDHGRTWCRAAAASPGRPNLPKHDPGDGYFMRHLGARFAAPHPGNIDADPAAMEGLLCDSDLDTTATQAPGRHRTSGPVHHSYEA